MVILTKGKQIFIIKLERKKQGKGIDVDANQTFSENIVKIQFFFSPQNPNLFHSGNLAINFSILESMSTDVF